MNKKTDSRDRGCRVFIDYGNGMGTELLGVKALDLSVTLPPFDVNYFSSSPKVLIQEHKEKIDCTIKFTAERHFVYCGLKKFPFMRKKRLKS